MLTSALASVGLHVYSTQSYMSRVRGGVNSYDIRISDRVLFSPREKADLLVALNEESLESERGGVAEGGVVVYDGKSAEGVTIGFDMADAAKSAGGTPQMANSIAAGVAFTLLGLDTDSLCKVLFDLFGKKKPDVAELNCVCARKGAELAAQWRGLVKPPPRGAPSGEVISGSDAIGLSAAVSGVKVVCSYPMTPSTGAFTQLAALADEYGIVVEQAEDEIAAINMVCGAAFAGVPAMTTTSGGGFALMVEGLSLSGMLELPAVILLSQRPGPATGLPTRTAQQDLHFAVFAGHGEFARAVYAPGTIAQGYELMRVTLETAHRYQTPAIIMVDQFITDLQQNVPAPGRAPDPIDRRILEKPPADYVRYEVTDDGVSPRAIPGSGAFVVVDSDEHTPDGHITEDLNVRVIMQDKRMRKAAGLLAETLDPEIYPAPAAEVFLCWGSTYGPCREAVDILRSRGRDVCLAHYPQVWPIDPAKASAPLKGRKVTAVEGSFGAQFAALLKMAGALGDYSEITRYDGLPFTAEYIVREAEK
jgi:2-oxoglutarate ferredoxin oxidoreductase subunit alpha